jgi:photosystem II stability/assembly factor-like uncharacterized protein
LSTLASDATGFIFVAGSSNSPGITTPDAAQSQVASHAYYRSEDGGATWSAGSLDAGQVNQIVTANGTLYAGTDQGLFASTDKGLTWNRLLTDPVLQIVLDPAAPATLYILRGGAASQLAKTTDGGITWQDLDPGAPAHSLIGLAIDPTHPATLYAGARRVYRSDDGGATWSASPELPGNGILAIAVDPANPSVLYIATSPQYVGGGPAPSIPVSPSLMRSTDGGRTFLGTLVINYVTSVTVDPVHPGTAYAAGTAVYKTTDFGAHWDTLRQPANPNGYTVPAAVVDNSGAVIVGAPDGRLFRSDDGGVSFAPLSSFSIYGATSFVIADGVVHLAGRRGSNALIAKLDFAGNVTYATYWGGRAFEQATGIALDDAGNIYVSGNATSADFPQRDGLRQYSGGADSFVLKLDPAGTVVYSTLWGGSSDEYTLAVGATPDGQVYFGGITQSHDFPAALQGTTFLVGLH